MSKRKSNENLVGLLSFVALLISGVCFILHGLDIGNGLLSIIGDVCLVIVVLYSAWSFARGLKKAWRITYFILAILVIVGLVFGGFSL